MRLFRPTGVNAKGQERIANKVLGAAGAGVRRRGRGALAHSIPLAHPEQLILRTGLQFFWLEMMKGQPVGAKVGG